MSLATDAESRLAARERTIARLQALARAATWTLDPWTGEAEWSDDLFALFGLDRSAAPSFDALAATLDPAHRQRWRQAFAEACRKRPVSGVECDIRQPSGKRRRIRLYIDPEPGEDGRVARLTGICQDVTGDSDGAPDLDGQPAAASVEQITNLLMVVIDNVDYVQDLAGGDEAVARALKTAGEAARLGLDLASPGHGAERAQIDAGAGPERQTEHGAGAAVLVVDDEAALRKLVATMVASLGFGVVEAASGEEALQALAERPDIGLVVSDLVMAGINGAELAVRALEIRPELKILLASGFDGPELASVARLGAVDVISKPFTRAALADKVRQGLAAVKAA